MYQIDKCDKCLSPEHEGNFCKCESRNMWVARELRKAEKNPWGKDNCRISGCRNFATICINCGREVCTKTFSAPNEWIDREKEFPTQERILCTAGGGIFICQRHNIVGDIHYFSTEWNHREYPNEEPTWTHWMPLPQPPKEE